jgi:hypothetical protein
VPFFLNGKKKKKKKEKKKVIHAGKLFFFFFFFFFFFSLSRWGPPHKGNQHAIPPKTLKYGFSFIFFPPPLMEEDDGLSERACLMVLC